jgi:hypothetical protein
MMSGTFDTLGPRLEVLDLCNTAIASMMEAYRIVAKMDVPYVADMLYDAIDTVEQVVGDVLVKG